MILISSWYFRRLTGLGVPGVDEGTCAPIHSSSTQAGYTPTRVDRTTCAIRNIIIYYRVSVVKGRPESSRRGQLNRLVEPVLPPVHDPTQELGATGGGGHGGRHEVIFFLLHEVNVPLPCENRIV